MRILPPILLLALLWGCAKPSGYEVDTQNRVSPSDQSLDRFIEIMATYRSVSGLPVRVYFQGECGVTHQPYFQDVPFPVVRMDEAEEGAEELEFLRSIFRKDDTIRIAQDEKKIIRIQIGDPEKDILTTRIANLPLTENQQYNGRRAINAIESSYDVKAASERLGLKQTIPTLLGIGVAPSDKLPNLPAALKGVTMDEALDMIAVTLGDIVIYGACASQYTVRAY